MNNNSVRLVSRMKRELQMLEQDPPHGIQAWPKEDSLTTLEAQMQGPEGTPYEKGIFKLEITIPDRYPMEPPNLRFATPVFHPNIDSGGRICLDIIKMPPQGAWKPALNISTVLTSIQSLLAEPNPDDGLMAEIVSFLELQHFTYDTVAARKSDLYKTNRPVFIAKAREYTLQHASAQQGPPAVQSLTLSSIVKHNPALNDEDANSDDQSSSDDEKNKEITSQLQSLVRQSPLIDPAAEKPAAQAVSKRKRGTSPSTSQAATKPVEPEKKRSKLTIVKKN